MKRPSGDRTNIMKYLIIAILLSSCGSAFHLKQAERHLRKAEIKGAKVRVDTVYKTISVIVPETRIDTVLTVQNFRDTITLEKDKIVTKIKFDTLTRRLYVHTLQKADTVFIEVPFTVTKQIKSGWLWWWLIVAALAGSGLSIIINHKRNAKEPLNLAALFCALIT
jgi:hypothetical protein